MSMRETMKKLMVPTEVPMKHVADYADLVTSHLNAALAAVGEGEPQSPQVLKEIEKRTAPSSRANHTSLSSAVWHVAIEIQDIGSRVHRYQYIERYRDIAGSIDKSMTMALLDHTHSLKSYEVYTILERTCELLKFSKMVADNLSIPGIMNDRKFLNDFKKTFSYRLRERHRIVHAHERPSLMSRLTALDDVGMEAWLATPQFLEMMKAISQVREMLQEQMPDEDIPSFGGEGTREQYIRRGDKEASKMWAMIVKYCSESIKLASAT